MTSELSGDDLLIATKKSSETSRGSRSLSLKTSISQVLDQISEFGLRHLVADVESFLATGHDVAITSSAFPIRTVLSFFSSSKSICDAVSGAIALIFVAIDAGGPRNSETAKIF